MCIVLTFELLRVLREPLPSKPMVDSIVVIVSGVTESDDSSSRYPVCL